MHNALPIMDLGNTRDPEQRRIMEEQDRNGICHFCLEGFTERHSHPIIFQNKSWFVTKNSFPYTGAEHHYLVVSKKHCCYFTDLTVDQLLDLRESMRWLEEYTKAEGFSHFTRNGNLAYTGATFSHLHYHFLSGGPRPEDRSPNFPDDFVLAVVGFQKK